MSLMGMPAIAADSQQNRMKSCNAEAKAKSLKGDERRAFMKQCLSGSARAKPVEQEAQQTPPPPPGKKGSQRQRMKSCNEEARAKQLKGQERRDFMKVCLKADASAKQ